MTDSELQPAPELQPMSPERKRAYLAAFATPVVLAPIWLLTINNWQPGHFVGSLSGMLLLITVIVAGITDAKNQLIYDWITLPAILWALTLNAWASATGNVDLEFNGLPSTEIGIVASLQGAGVCLLICLTISVITGGGGGDIKIMTAIAAMLGWSNAVKILVNAYIIGGTCIVLFLIWQIGPWKIVSTFLRTAGSRLLPKRIAKPDADQERAFGSKMALGPYFALATIIVLCGLDRHLFTF